MELRQGLSQYAKVVVAAAKDAPSIKPHWLFDVATRLTASCNLIVNFLNKLQDDSRHQSLAHSHSRQRSSARPLDSAASAASGVMSLQLPDGTDGRKRSWGGSLRPRHTGGDDGGDEDAEYFDVLSSSTGDGAGARRGGQGRRLWAANVAELQQAVTKLAEVTHQLAAQVETSAGDRRVLLQAVEALARRRQQLLQHQQQQQDGDANQGPNGVQPPQESSALAPLHHPRNSLTGSIATPIMTMSVDDDTEDVDRQLARFLQQSGVRPDIVQTFIDHVSGGRRSKGSTCLILGCILVVTGFHLRYPGAHDGEGGSGVAGAADWVASSVREAGVCIFAQHQSSSILFFAFSKIVACDSARESTTTA